MNDAVAATASTCDASAQTPGAPTEPADGERTDVDVDGDTPPEAAATAANGKAPWVFRAPRVSDPRMHVAAVIISVQVLGQVVLGFDISIAQILFTVGTAALVEFAMVAVWKREIAWPASGMLTGNGAALLLRVPGTEHGDWWSTRGWPIFVACASFSVLVKYVVRVDGRPLFNPSNLGLVVIFLWFGPLRVDPQDLWWGPWSPKLAITIGVIVIGGLTLARRLRMFDTALVFWCAFTLGLALLASRGHWFSARWHLGSVVGWEWWRIVALSPETLIFTFFMVTDPSTSPRGRLARPAYAAAVGASAAGLVAFQRTEYATKVSLLLALTVVCALRPLFERFLGDDRARTDTRWWTVVGGGTAPPLRPTMRGVAAVLVVLAVWAGVLVGGNRIMPAPPGSSTTLVSDGEPIVDTGLPITLAPALEGVDGLVTIEDGRRMVADLEVALAAEDTTLRTGNLAAVDGLVYGRESARIHELVERGDRWFPLYRWERFEVVLLRDPISPQSQPQLGIRAVGLIGSARAAGTAHVTDVEEATAGSLVFLLSPVDGRYAIGHVLEPTDPMIVGP